MFRLVVAIIVYGVVAGFGEFDVGLEETHGALTLSVFNQLVINVNGELIVIGWHNVSVFDILIDRLI